MNIFQKEVVVEITVKTPQKEQLAPIEYARVSGVSIEQDCISIKYNPVISGIHVEQLVIFPKRCVKELNIKFC